MTLLVLLAIVSVSATMSTVRLVHRDGLGDRPGPRSHDPDSLTLPTAATPGR